MKHWSEYPSQQPAHRKRVRLARELRESEAAATLVALRQVAARRAGFARYPASLISSYEAADQARRRHGRTLWNGHR